MFESYEEHLLEEAALFWDKDKGRKAGRPTLDELTLATDRDALVWLLSVAWGEIGWQLPRARTLPKLREALEPLRGHPSDHLIARFLRPTSVIATAKDVRESRKALGKAVEQLREAEDRHNRCTEACGEAESAVTQAGPEQRKAVEAEFQKRQAELELVRTQLDAATVTDKRLTEARADKEASFSQTELLDFITRKKYARNPLGLANAMAGLPDMGWRQSYVRCSKMKCPSWPHFQFREFNTIQTIWNRRHSHPGLTPIELFRQGIKKLPKTVEVPVPQSPTQTARKTRVENFLRSRLAENWMDFRLAIEQSLTAEHDSRRVPFHIVSQFSKNIAKPKTAADRVLAAAQRIE